VDSVTSDNPLLIHPSKIETIFITFKKKAEVNKKSQISKPLRKGERKGEQKRRINLTGCVNVKIQN
jgi:hypothetical protein